MALGVQQYRQKGNALADQLDRSPCGMSQALAKGIAKREEDEIFRDKLAEIDHA